MSPLASGRLGLWLEGIGLIAPGIPSWETGTRVLRGVEPFRAAPSVLPTPKLLPPAECRRASRVVKLCLAVGLEACATAQRPAAELASVFCSSNADGHTIHAILESLAGSDRMISPTRFHNSVHNAAAGYWSIATRSRRPYQVLCAFDATFAAALLETAAQAHADGLPVLMLAFDSEYPEPLHACRPIPDVGGIGFVVNPARAARACAALQLHLEPGAPAGLAIEAERGKVATAPAQDVSQMSLAELACRIPALAGMPLLHALANGLATTIRLPYLPGQCVVVEVQPC
jgi:hypothetical protein